jgi:hypothetical protein
VATDRYALTFHFAARLEERGFYWPDVQRVLDAPQKVRFAGADRFGRPKWIVRGEAATGDLIEVVCAIEPGEAEVEFITIYWDS